MHGKCPHCGYGSGKEEGGGAAILAIEEDEGAAPEEGADFSEARAQDSVLEELIELLGEREAKGFKKPTPAV